APADRDVGQLGKHRTAGRRRGVRGATRCPTGAARGSTGGSPRGGRGRGRRGRGRGGFREGGAIGRAAAEGHRRTPGGHGSEQLAPTGTAGGVLEVLHRSRPVHGSE